MNQSASPHRALFAPLALLTVLAVVTGTLAFYQISVSRQSQNWTLRSHEVIEAAQAAFSDAQDVEAGVRGYLLTGSPTYVADFQHGLEAYPEDIARLQALVSDNPEQLERARVLDESLKTRIDLASGWIAWGRGESFTTAFQNRQETGRSAMDRARGQLSELVAAEEALLAERVARSARIELAGVAIALVAGALAILGLVYLFVTTLGVVRNLRREVEARELAETAQRKSDQLYRAVFDNAGDFLFVIDAGEGDEFVLLDGNKAFAEGAGHPIERLRGRTMRKLQPGRLGEELTERYAEVSRTKNPLSVSTEVPLSHGVRTWESTLVPVANEAGEVDRIVGVSRDITERLQAEAQRAAAQKLEAIGQLTGGVAHDFNNLLQVIQSNLQMIETDTRDRPAAAVRLKNALRGVERAASLTRSLLAFARRQPLAPKVVNLGRLVTEMDEMLKGALGEEVAVTTQVPVGLWNTLADTAQFETAVLNLAINARDAMGHKGRLTISLSNETVEAAFDGDEADAGPGDYVLVVVSDTGEGMTAEIRERAFDPFFTTKDDDRGTGLGLSMVYGFVKQSKGHIEIESTPGAGATIKIYLPRCDAAEEAPAETPAKSPPSAAGTILVVDDEELVRDAAVGMLRELGYDCLIAASGAQALEVLESGRRIDLLFTDVVMPGPVSAKALAERARAIVPGLPVLFTSGYARDAITSHGRLDEGVSLISKPYEKADLARRIAQALAASRPQVLVVEDEGLVRMSALDMISALGFSVLEAGDADEALDILRNGERVDVLFTDVGLPGMRGPELALEAQKARPGLKVVFASGYGEGQRGPPAGSVHLSKPYDQDDLAKVLRD